jgi:hypothetical protein
MISGNLAQIAGKKTLAMAAPTAPMPETSKMTICSPDKLATAAAAGNARHQALTYFFEESALSHAASFDQRRRPETLRTAMATAFFWPNKTKPGKSPHPGCRRRSADGRQHGRAR